MYLEKIKSPNDVKAIPLEHLPLLAEEMRKAILNRVSKVGGHFGPNFGMVEATIALHYVFESPKDKIVYDVSHQSYPHKLLTGRAYGFMDDNRFGEIGGYTNPKESEHDFFKVGHTSTALSLACGLAKGRDLQNGSGNIIAVVGDGSLSGGEALEGLNFAGAYDKNLIIVINDNDMSIAENHGGIYQNLALLRETKGQAMCNLFRSFGLEYMFVDDGNDLTKLISAFASVKNYKKPIVVHIATQKGKGYALAEQDRENWHFHAPFNPQTGRLLNQSQKENYSSLTCEFLLNAMQKDSKLCVVTAGTPTVGGFTQEMRQRAGKQFVDVGIAEEHAVALCSGTAKNGGTAVFPVYASFLQRTFDQLFQDLCINNNPVTIPVFSASIYGMSDVTHLGIYDIPELTSIPNLVYLAPTCKEEYLAMMAWSMQQREHPVAIRVPGIFTKSGIADTTDYSKLNTYKVAKQGEDIAILAMGTLFGLGERLASAIARKTGKQPTLINPVFLSGVDEELLLKLIPTHTKFVTLEDGTLDGGFGAKIAMALGNKPVSVYNYGIRKQFFDCVPPEKLLEENGVTVENIINDIGI
jgi:1-deoxy-D-xylulose-5-phosphate synthase